VKYSDNFSNIVLVLKDSSPVYADNIVLKLTIITKAIEIFPSPSVGEYRVGCEEIVKNLC